MASQVENPRSLDEKIDELLNGFKAIKRDIEELKQLKNSMEGIPKRIEFIEEDS